MKFKFKIQQYQTDAVERTVEVFTGQPSVDNLSYRRDLGKRDAQTSLYDTGSVIKHEETKFLSEKMCKIISCFFGILSFILVFMFDTNKDFLLKKKDKKSFVAGVPVYDLPQI